VPLEVDFNNNLYIEAYDMLYDSLKGSGEKGCGISWQEFRYSYPIFCFDLTLDSSANAGHFQVCHLLLTTKCFAR